MKTYIHYGSSKFDPERFEPVHNRLFFTKPSGGLWASAVGIGGWKAWCEQEDFPCSDQYFCFRLRDPAKVAVIRSIADAENLPQQDVIPVLGMVGSDTETARIDFEALKKQGIDAVELEWYEAANSGKDNMYMYMYGWDCDSIVVLNPDAVVPV